MPAAKHIHKYKLLNLSRNPGKEPYYVYRCQLPNCSHHIEIRLSVGKLAICWHCGEPFKMKKQVWTRPLVKPHCGCKFVSKIDDKLDVLVRDLTKGIK